MGLVRREFLQGALAAASTIAFPSCEAARAQSYPARPIRVIVPVAAGGPVDVITRTIVQKVCERLGSQFHVENIPTGAGNVATGAGAKAAPDGHTLLAVTTALSINPSLYNKLPYEPVRDFSPLTLVATSPHVLVVNPALPAADLKELVRLVRNSPGKYSYASPGAGQSGQLAGEMFRLACGLDLAHVPFNGAIPAITATVAGHTQIAVMSLAAAAGSIKDAKLRALAVTSAKRSNVFPNIPTMAEMDIAGQESAFWQGIVFPAGTSREIIDRWYREVVTIVALPEVQSRLDAMSFEPVANAPAEFAAVIKTEISKWRGVIESAGMQKLDN